MNPGFHYHPDEAISNTMNVAVRADQHLRISHIQKALADVAVRDRWLADANTLIVGGGSNILFVRERLDKVVQLDASNSGFIDEGDTVLAWAEAGLGLDKWVRWTVKQGWYGLERLAEIPGTVGAAPIQNVGAYGVQLSDVLVRVELWDREQQRRVTWQAAECGFSYRHSRFKAEPTRWLILSVTVRLHKTPPHDWPQLNYPGLHEAALHYLDDVQGTTLAVLTPHDFTQIVTRVRLQKLPDWRQPALGSLGSFFQNPIVANNLAAHLKENWPNLPIYPQHEINQSKLSAGWLIEQAGWRGYTQNHAGIYEKHALVLVNLGGARGIDLWDLAKQVQADVFRKFGVRLMPEPLVI
ncbi:MAG TPA: UDP-N-acetylmuramate dehydrogenase [Halothiobacillus sp.]|nr:MAG: UDP-N-acetylenolpyruvoylglucosamine reductase [Halothiobacillus sp. 20-54-6]HQT43285.1 UDP-N-acetylmuramate dehydrogenase [Halothiobacillus sp.]